MDDDYLKWLMGDVYGFEDTSPDLPKFYAQAACRDHDPALWFPEGRGVQPTEALAVCASCPVRQECLQHALEHDERIGIWGGMRERERAKLARRAA